MRKLFLLVSVFFAFGNAFSKEKKQPNLLILLTDDQRPNTLTCYDENCPIPTPNIDALATGGIRFNNAFVSSPICCVSRASILTGRYACNNRMHYFDYPLPEDVFTITYPVLLRKAGYFVGALGKYGVGITEKVKETFDVLEGQSGQGPAFREYKGKKMHDAEWLTVKTNEFLDQIPEDKPFCLQVNYKEPHYTSEPAPEDEHLLDNYLFKRELTDTPEEFAKLPEYVQRGYGRKAYEKEFNAGGDINPFMRWYHEKVASVERSIGEIMKELELRGLADNTVIIFLSDHGQHNGEKQLFGKWTPYEQSLRTPFIIYDPRPGSVKSVVSEEMVLNIDVAPTLLELAGVPIPKVMDGKSMVRLMEGKGGTFRDHFFFEHYCSPSKAMCYIPRNEGMRSKTGKYVRWIDTGGPVIESYYDLANDPSESNNLIENPAYAKKVKNARSEFETWRARNPANFDYQTYGIRPQYNSKEIDWARFKETFPKEYARIENAIHKLGVSWEQAANNKNIRYQVSDLANYWY